MTPETQATLDLIKLDLNHTNGRISAYFELQVKIITLGFSTTLAIAGWIFSGKTGADPNPNAITLFILSGFFSITGLLALIFNGLALKYMDYKANVLFPKYLKLVETPHSFVPLIKLRHPSDETLQSSTLALHLATLSFNSGIMAYATYLALQSSPKAKLLPLFLFAGIVLVALFWCSNQYRKDFMQLANQAKDFNDAEALKPSQPPLPPPPSSPPPAQSEASQAPPPSRQ